LQKLRIKQFPPSMRQRTRSFTQGCQIFSIAHGQSFDKNGQNALFLKNFWPKIHMLMD